jgi:predicted nucleic acid-binding protein
MTDCMIAAVAIRLELPLLTTDRDFAAIARHTPLQLADT